MAELKPCPFCGNSAWANFVYKPHSNKTRCVVKCTKCNARLEYRDEKSAVSAWNRRADNG
jgi:Lar family restriction alleviation protein